MKHIIFLSILLLSSIVQSQDTLVRTNGKIMLGKIESQDSLKYYISFYKNYQKFSTSVYKNDIAEIRYKQMNNDTTEKKVKSQINLTIGYSNPMGNYGQKVVDNNPASLAGYGVSSSINYLLTFNKYFGIGCKLYYGKNFLREDLLYDYYYQKNGVSLSISSTPFVLFGFLAGPMGSIPVNKKISLVANTNVGLIEMKTAGYTLSGKAFAPKVFLLKTYEVNLGINYSINKSSYLVANIGYMRSLWHHGVNKHLDTYIQAIQDLNKPLSVQYYVLNFSVGIGTTFK